MRTASAAVATLVACALLAGAASAGGSARPRVTLFGDSVAAALAYQATARKTLGKGLDLQIDAKVCRRLAETGCPYQGDRPQSVLSLVTQPARPLGSVVVIDVGYNDVPSDYGADIDRVMQALVRQDVTTVIWVTLQERRVLYRRRMRRSTRPPSAGPRSGSPTGTTPAPRSPSGSATTGSI